jgi:hypothetical protein
MSASRLTGRRRFGHCNDAHGNEILTTGAARPPAQRSAVQLMGIGCVNDARQSAGIQRPATGFSTTGAPITRVPITTVASGSSDQARRGTSPHEGNGLRGPRCGDQGEGQVVQHGGSAFCGDVFYTAKVALSSVSVKKNSVRVPLTSRVRADRMPG